MQYCFILITIVFAMLFVGCDDIFNIGGKKAAELEARERAEQRAQAEAKRDEQDRFAEQLRRTVDLKITDAKESVKNINERLQSYRADIKQFNDCVREGMAEKRANGEEADIETKLLHLMRNQEISKLALKYLSGDFSSIAAEFIERIRTARAAEKRYEVAIKQIDEAYAQEIAESKKWVNATNAQREKEEKRLKQEINELTRKRDTVQKEFSSNTKRGLIGSSQLEREQSDKRRVVSARLNELDNEIDKRRRQLETLRNPAAERWTASTLQNVQRVNSVANLNRERATYTAGHNIKPKQSVHEIVKEYEQKTIGLLRDKLQTVEKQLAGELELANAKIIELKKLQQNIPISTMPQLQKIRDQLIK